VAIAEQKYGGDILIEFTKDGTEFTGTHDSKAFCTFQSSEGPVGIHGGNFRVSSGERRNFILGVISLVIILQQDAIIGSQTKGIGIKFVDNGQKPRKKLEDQVADSKGITAVISPKSASAKLGAAGDVPYVETSSKKGSQPVDSISPRDKLPRRAVTHSVHRGSLEKDKEKAASPRHTKGHTKTIHKKQSDEKKTIRRKTNIR